MPILDDNLTRFIRNRNIFDPGSLVSTEDGIRIGEAIQREKLGIPSEQTMMPDFRQVSTTPRSDLPDIRSRMNEMYKPELEMQDRYRQHIDQFPERQKPSFARKLTASLAGAGGDINKADAVLNEPFYRGVKDWETKGKMLSEAATNESRINRDQANFALQEISRQLQAERLELDKLKNDQIYQTKLAELETKITTADNNLKLAYDRLAVNKDNQDAMMQFRQSQLDAMNARHAAEMAMRELQYERQNRETNARINRMNTLSRLNEQRASRGQDPISEEQVIWDAEGNVIEFRTVTRTRGDEAPRTPGVTRPPQSGSITMIGKDGKSYQIPPDKVEQARKDGFRHPSRKEQ